MYAPSSSSASPSLKTPSAKLDRLIHNSGVLYDPYYRKVCFRQALFHRDKTTLAVVTHGTFVRPITTFQEIPEDGGILTQFIWGPKCPKGTAQIVEVKMVGEKKVFTRLPWEEYFQMFIDLPEAIYKFLEIDSPRHIPVPLAQWRSHQKKVARVQDRLKSWGMPPLNPEWIIFSKQERIQCNLGPLDFNPNQVESDLQTAEPNVRCTSYWGVSSLNGTSPARQLSLSEGGSGVAEWHNFPYLVKLVQMARFNPVQARYSPCFEIQIYTTSKQRKTAS